MFPGSKTIREFVGNVFPITKTGRTRRSNNISSLISQVERLEIRKLLTGGPIAVAPATAANVLHPDFMLSHATPFASTSPSGLTPSQMRQAYGMTNIQFGSIVGDGTGQTIAIVDAYDDPTALSDLMAFDSYFGLANPPSFTVVNQNGLSSPLPSPSGSTGWSIEESLDFEWAHVMAPQAKIVLFEANSTSFSDLFTAVSTAKAYAGVSVVSMSFGTTGDASGETAYDSTFLTPNGHQGVTFVAATGDNGKPGGYPAYSPNVVAVGGTTLTLNGSGGYGSESGWSGSGGGVSTIETEPTFQTGVQSTGKRTIPDVAMDADPNSGVPVYDSYDFGGSAPWAQYGGTSLATPLFAGIIAVTNQGRVHNGLGTLDGSTETLPALYKLPTSDYHDITTGNNGYQAGVGYDYVTGIGSPIPDNKFVPHLVGGGTLTVINLNDSGTGSLRDAVTTANADNSGDTINFASNLAGGTIRLTSGQLSISGSMTITGLGANQLTIDGGWDGVTGDSVGSRIFDVTASAVNVTISGLTLTHGNASTLGGGAISNEGQLRLDHDVMTVNSASGGNGGGVLNNATLISGSCTISGNVSDFGGGVNNVTSGIWTSYNDTIANNTVKKSGGGVLSKGNWISTNDTIAGNSAINGGGGVGNTGVFKAINTIISGNSVGDLSGVISNTTTSNLVGGTVSQILATDAIGKPVLANNGGSTQTIALIYGSSAIGNAVSLTTLAQQFVAGATTFKVNSATFISVGEALQIDGDIVTVTGTNGTTITVARATGGGTNHANGAAISLAYDQTDVKRVNNDIGAVEEFAPAITTQPTNQVVISGNQATFTAAAAGNNTPTVQWQLSTDGGATYANIAGATSTSLNFTTDPTQSGDLYRAVFTNVVGSVITSAAVLTVQTVPVITTQPTNQTVVLGNQATFTAAASGSPTPTVQWQVSKNGGASYTNIVGATSTTLNVTTATSLNGYLYQAVFTNSAGSATTNAVQLTVVYAPMITTQPTSQIGTAGTQVTFTAVAVGNPTPTIQWQYSTDAGTTFTNIAGATTTNLVVNVTTSQYAYFYRAVFTNSVGSAVTNLVGLQTAPGITTQPVNQTVVAGGQVTFTAVASGNPVPSIQWQYSPDGGKIFINIAGATSTTLNVTPSASQDGYLYRAVFTNSLGRATTNVATLTVQTAPSITTQPANQTVVSASRTLLGGIQVTFTAAASGNPVPTVQWQVSTDGAATFINIPNATSTSLKITTDGGPTGYFYRAVFSNVVGSATTNAVTWTIQTSPAITIQPNSQAVVSGSQATFTAAAFGNPTPSVQWQVSANSGTTYTNVAGATSTTLNVTTNVTQNHYLYRAVFSNAAGTATTAPATLTVQTAPSITIQPTSQTVASGSQVTLTAAAIGDPTPTVQWQVSTDGGKTYNNISGATSTTLKFVAAASQNGYLYRAVFTNAIGSVITSAAKLTVR